MFDFITFWQMHTPILSILIPAITAFVLVLLGNPGAAQLALDWRQPWRRGISLVSALLGLITAIYYLMQVSNGQIYVYELSQWSAPFGIVLVLDQLSAFMLVLAYGLALPLLWFASKDWDQRGRYFHAMSHFLLMGICGAFLTGDLFNLFVFFEILLMASYVLLLHGQGKARFQLGVHYVAINLLASAMFLIGLGMIYASVGSLNMADVSRLLATLDPEQYRLATAGGLMLFVVFGIKAAMLPVGFWLPKTYAVATTPVAALFALMTKVGVYSILRVNGTVFNDGVAQHILSDSLLVIGLVTSLYGVIGALGAERLRRFVGFMVLSSIGTILIGIAIFEQNAWAASLYYLVHSTVVVAAFYLLSGWITSQRGEFKDHLKVAPKMKQEKPIALAYFMIALMMAGLPPFSGFLGKVFLLHAAVTHPAMWIIFPIILIVSLLSIIAFTRVGLVLFWRATQPEDNPNEPAYADYQALPGKAPARNPATLGVLLFGLIGYTAFAQPIYQYTTQAASQLQDQSQYVQAVLKADGQGNIISIQPFDSGYLPETKYGGENPDRNAALIPYIVHPDALNGVNISEYKKRQIADQQLAEAAVPEGVKLQPTEQD